MKKKSESWQTDLLSKINTFENTFAERRAALLQSLKDLSCQETRKQMVETFLQGIDKRSMRVLRSQGYARAQVTNSERTDLYLSPVKLQSFRIKKKPKAKSPMKENSPLKKMGSLKKQSRQVDLENSESPLKTFGQGPSPQKRGNAKIVLKTTSNEHVVSTFASP